MSLDGAKDQYEHGAPHGRLGGPERRGAGSAPEEESFLALGGATILLVEDDALNREALELVFSYYGAQVLSAESTAQALAQYDRATPSILVSDIGLPDVDGCVLLRMIRERESGFADRTPAIAISGSQGADANRRAHAAGFDIFLVKPISVWVLLHAMQNLLTREER